MNQYNNDLILRVLRGEHVERPPVWLMRQAGRILPQYRAIRNSLSGFKELVSSPDLVAEVTVQPVDELGVDAAIIFSDILVIPEAMGLDYEMVESKGPFFPKTIQSTQDILQLRSGDDAAEHLEYVYDGIKRTKILLGDRLPLIGFSGSPFTLLSYMVEGQGSKTFSKAKKLLYSQPQDAHALMQKLTVTIISYLHKKVDAGVDIIQLFDSWSGVLDRDTYNSFCMPYIKRISTEIEKRVPVIIFSRGAWFSLQEIHNTGSKAIGLDWNTPVHFARKVVGSKKVLQGNLDPCVLYGNYESIRAKTVHMLAEFGRNHIANLGHGVYPDTPLEAVRCFVNTVKEYRYSDE